jgi:sugar phosphate isomerase/epimerase
MESPIHTKNPSEAERNISILTDLISSSEIIGAKDIVIPCVDQSSLKSESDIDLFIKRINRVLPDLDHKDINLSLETDLCPHRFLDLLDKFDSNRITVNYDIGNSASLGYDPIEELDAYGDRISDIHIKDRLLNGPSVVLGDGEADFERFFSKLKSFNYKGPFIMQAYRDDEGIGIFKSQLYWIKPFLEQYND